MKIRSGFVSNSSSSSFIIGVGLVRSGKEDEARKIFGEYNVLPFFQTIVDASEKPQWCSRLINDNGDITVESAHSSVTVHDVFTHLKETNQDDVYFVVLDGSGDEPPYIDGSGYDYDGVDLDSFSKQDVKRYKTIQQSDIIFKGDVLYGGEYDG